MKRSIDRTFVYASFGREMLIYSIDVASGALRQASAVTMPQTIQYGWANGARTILYVATSGAGPMAAGKVQEHYVQAFWLEQNGGLSALAAPLPLRHRPLHLSLDREERHLLIAYNDPPHVTVHAINAGGGIGEEIAQSGIAFGPTVHQVRVTPYGTIAVVPCCAHHPQGELSGSVQLFIYRNGALSPFATIEADPARAGPWRGVRHGAHGFAPRHVDFHPTKPWMYLSVETQGELHLYDFDEKAVALKARVIASTLEGSTRGPSAQMTSAVHVHPSGRFVYVANRAHDAETIDGRQVFRGGVNDLAVFSIDPSSGVPSLIQHADTFGVFPRSFGIDPSGTVLVVGNQEASFVRTPKGIARVLPSLAVFRIGEDGRLTFLHKHDFPDNGEACFWVNVLSPSRREA